MSVLNLFSKEDKDFYKPIVIFGEARSGTTWLAQIIAASGYELNFEPLGSMNFPKDYIINCNPVPSYYHISKGEKSVYKEYIDLVMNCEIKNKFTHRGNINIGKPKKVIKLIRANLMIDWIQDNYDFYGIFIIRNPLATINSQMKYNMWGHIQKLGPTKMLPERVINYFNEDQKELIKSVKMPKERLAVFWCINNKIALTFSNKKNLRIVKYEDLVKNPKKVIKDLSKFAHFPYNNKVKNAIKRKSFTTRKETEQIKNYDPTKAWKENFTQEEIDSIVEIVKAFNLEEYLDL
jgi:hypothetical protein